MKLYFLRSMILVASVLTGANGFAQQFKLKQDVVLRVVIIRHGEKPAKGDNLDCMGLNRALALPAVLDTVTGKPDFTYVPTISTGKKTNNVRMFQTVTPFAVHQNLTINTNYKETDSTGAAQDVLGRSGVVLMVWEHGNIPPLARALVGKKNEGIIPAWHGNDFGSIWIIEYTASKKGKPKFKQFFIEQEHITPSGVCP